jgi:mannose-1-phosphate guanylyltransferase
MSDYALIMAGGSGTRLWPLSRQQHPKQALQLVGERTMFQMAVDRLAPMFPPENILVVTRADYAEILSAQTPALPKSNFIVEPEGRGTAPAIGLAAVHIRLRDPGAVMSVLTADHFVADDEGFRRALRASAQAARQGYLVTLGIQPSSPSTGFGYIQQGPQVEIFEDLPVYSLGRFTEKPALETARKMLAEGGYSWNSGMFIWKVERILAEFERQMPEFYAQLVEIAAGFGTPAEAAVLAKVWPGVGKQTIDYGVMEGATSAVVIPVDIGWTDVGSWASLTEVLPPDAQGNAVRGEHLGIGTRNSLIIGGKRLIATIGLEDIVIVDTEDALLVCTKEREQEVREIVRRLSESGMKNWLYSLKGIHHVENRLPQPRDPFFTGARSPYQPAGHLRPQFPLLAADRNRRYLADRWHTHRPAGFSNRDRRLRDWSCLDGGRIPCPQLGGSSAAPDPGRGRDSIHLRASHRF